MPTPCCNTHRLQCLRAAADGHEAVFAASGALPIRHESHMTVAAAAHPQTQHHHSMKFSIPWHDLMIVTVTNESSMMCRKLESSQWLRRAMAGVPATSRQLWRAMTASGHATPCRMASNGCKCQGWGLWRTIAAV